jgi:DNA-binding NtrC family response regulator
MIVCEGTRVRAADLPPRIRGEVEGHPAQDGSGSLNLAEAVANAVQRVERVLIRAALATHKGNRSATAASLGVNRKTLFYKMREYGLTTDADVDE